MTWSQVSGLSLSEAKKLYDRLSSTFGYERMDGHKKHSLEVKNGKVQWFSPGYGPYPNEIIIVTEKPEEVSQYKLFFDLRKHIETLTSSQNQELDQQIQSLAQRYTEEDLDMSY